MDRKWEPVCLPNHCHCYCCGPKQCVIMCHPMSNNNLLIVECTLLKARAPNWGIRQLWRHLNNPKRKAKIIHRHCLPNLEDLTCFWEAKLFYFVSSFIFLHLGDLFFSLTPKSMPYKIMISNFSLLLYFFQCPLKIYTWVSATP